MNGRSRNRAENGLNPKRSKLFKWALGREECVQSICLPRSLPFISSQWIKLFRKLFISSKFFNFISIKLFLHFLSMLKSLLYCSSVLTHSHWILFVFFLSLIKSCESLVYFLIGASKHWPVHVPVCLILEQAWLVTRMGLRVWIFVLSSELGHQSCPTKGLCANFFWGDFSC